MGKTLTVDRFWEYRFMAEKDLKSLNSDDDINDIYAEIIKAIQISVETRKERINIK
jgi:hypothetical protein